MNYPSDRVLSPRIAQQIDGEPEYIEVSFDAKITLTVRVQKVSEKETLAELRRQIIEQIRALSSPLRKGSGLVWFNVGPLG